MRTATLSCGHTRTVHDEYAVDVPVWCDSCDGLRIVTALAARPPDWVERAAGERQDTK